MKEPQFDEAMIQSYGRAKAAVINILWRKYELGI